MPICLLLIMHILKHSTSILMTLENKAQRKIILKVNAISRGICSYDILNSGINRYVYFCRRKKRTTKHVAVFRNIFRLAVRQPTLIDIHVHTLP